MRAVRTLVCLIAVACCRPSVADDRLTTTAIAEKLDACPVVPANECGRVMKSFRTSPDPAGMKRWLDSVYFTNGPNCCEYNSSDSAIYVGLQNPDYSCCVDVTREAKSLVFIGMRSRPELARTWAAHRARGRANPAGRPGLAVDANSIDLSIYYGFGSLTQLGLDWFSDLLLDPSLAAVCRPLGDRDIEITGRRIMPPVEGTSSNSQAEDYSAVVRVSKDGTYAYLRSGTIRYSKPLTYAETTGRNEVEETATHPRLLSSKHTITDRSTSPPTITESEGTYLVGPEHTKGQRPLFQLSDFGLPEPDPAEFLPPTPEVSTAVPADPWGTYLWLFVLPPVGILLVLLGQRLKRPSRRAAPAPAAGDVGSPR